MISGDFLARGEVGGDALVRRESGGLERESVVTSMRDKHQLMCLLLRTLNL